MLNRITIFYLIVLLNVSALFADYNLSLNLKSMSPHIGQMLQIRVVDLDNGLEVGRKTIDAIPSADFTVELYVLLESHDYRIDLYADFNDNKMYDGAPSDHSWSMMLENVQASVEMDFTHNTNFDNIEFPDVVPLLDLVDEWDGIWDNPTYDASGSVVASVEMKDNNKTAILTLQAWGIFGDPNPVSYTLTGTVNDAGDSVLFVASPPWEGSITMTNGEISGTISYSDINITADVKGNYGRDQFIIYYHMVGAFDAEEIGVLQRDVDVNTLVKRDKPVSDEFRLYNNYPNPFNPSTVISFQIPVQADVTINIFNQLGQRVDSKILNAQTAGLYTWSWFGKDFYGSNLPSGIYFFEMIAKGINGLNYKEIKKMTLMK